MSVYRIGIMTDPKTMISIKGVKKKYRRGQINATTLQHELQSWWARKRRQEDPNSKIGDSTLSGEEFYALDGIDLTVNKGEAVGIIGRNGAGKSTLLKLLTRVTAPTEGEIDIYGRVTSMLEVGTGFNGELTGRENIYLNGVILGLSRKEVDERIDRIIAFSELEDFIDTPLKRYSSGMYTKLGFSVAVNLDSEIIIMDEVLAVGDIAFQNKCISEMKKAVSDGRTVLYVSHNMDQIRRLCTRCIVLEKGKIIFDGDTETAVGRYLSTITENNVVYDYTGYRRPDWLNDDRMRLISAECGNAGGMVRDGDPLRLKLTWRCDAPIENIGLRLELQDLAGMRLGTYVLYDICEGRPGETVTVSIEADVSLLRENNYRVIYCFFAGDPLGRYQNLDRVEGLSFMRVHEPGKGELEWDFKEWGYLDLKGASVTGIERSIS